MQVFEKAHLTAKNTCLNDNRDSALKKAFKIIVQKILSEISASKLLHWNSFETIGMDFVRTGT